MTLWGGARAPMTLLGGYLGAGKTTIVNRVLAAAGDEGRRLAVLVNDLGSVQVDAALIASQHDDTIELANGCICCSLVDGFAVALEMLRERPEPPDHILVELSGVAEPGRVVPWASTAGFRLDGVVVVADADQIRDRAADARLTGLVDAQLAAADLVLVTKTDLVGADVAAVVERWLEERTPAPQVRVVAGAVSPDVVLGPLRTGEVPAPRSATGGTAVHVHTEVVVPRLTVDDLRSRLEGLHDVVRIKGTVDTTEGPMLVQMVGRRLDLKPHDRANGSLTVIALDPGALETAVRMLEQPEG